MKSSSASYNCLLDIVPKRADWLMVIVAHAVAIVAVWLCGLSLAFKTVLSLLIVAMFCWQTMELRRVRRLEWQASVLGLVRIKQILAQKPVIEPMHDTCIQFIGPFVQLRGRLGGRVEYTLIWPWMIDAEQYRRLRRLQTSINQNDKRREKI